MTGPAAVLFDLDGTLVDSEAGIAASLAHAASVVGIPPATPEQVRALIGPPWPQGFLDVLGADTATAEALVDAYRGHYAEVGLYAGTVYPGIPEALATLSAAGVPMAVTTSKLTTSAREILRHRGLDAHFDRGVFGRSLDGTGASKAAVVALALAARPGAPVRALVGDRVHDVEGAHAHGLPCVGVTWGFGSPEELAPAEHLVTDPRDLPPVLTAPAARS